MKKILILGAGTGGTIMVNLLHKRLDKKEWSITVIDKDNAHYYQPGFLFIPFGLYTKEQITKEKSKFIPRDVEFILSEIERIDPQHSAVILKDGKRIPYDFLIVATGVDIMPDETPGLRDGWKDTIFDFYTIDGSTALSQKLQNFKRGAIAVHINEMPIKCPVAPLEFAFLCDWFFSRKKTRDDVEIIFVTPLSGAFTKPVAAKELGSLLEERNIKMVTDFSAERVDAPNRKLISYDSREVSYDLLVTIPTNMGAEMIEHSGMGDELRFVPTDPHTLQSKQHENIFVMGDATNLPSSKAGSVSHFQSETLAENLMRAAENKPLARDFDGHSNCFIETGYHQAILIDFNYEVEPLPGRFPFPVIGPMPLLKESLLNHLGKIAFRWIYWNMLLKARPIPFIPARMRMAGKKIPIKSQ
jgi:sulfide:quinone oxidoreductase